MSVSPLPTPCRLLIDPPSPGDWNMAVDEVLLHRAADGGVCVWRFYQWSQATLSLGYFQYLADRRRHAASRCCPVVRRPSGGGAIVHDIELTYSFAVPADYVSTFGRRRLYDVVHGLLIETLAEFGVEATLFAQNAACANRESSTACDSPFLCFERRSPGDVIVGGDKVAGSKVAGSAQRRQRETILQHGSVLLGRSAAAPELPGLNQFASCEIGADTLSEAWLKRLGDGLGLAFDYDELSDEELADVRRVAAEKYSSNAWTEFRGRK